KCIPCSKTVSPLKGDELNLFFKQLNPGWKVVDEHHLEKEYRFKNFQEALDFTNKVGAIAQEEEHHPDFYLTWGLVKILLWTHKINGLSENDFIMAAKCDAVYTQGTSKFGF
ncbi:MAG TPA: 4a-hydroxytetrahydrobiopterin dehydratase, partial [Puia sp.]|nr:4a-hydroxytetrahydrobiopterin dehydratase [Puia sp.]